MTTTVIDVWVADLTFPGYMDRLHRLAGEFNAAHPGYEVRITGKDFRELPGEFATAAREGGAPAVTECYFYITQVARDLVRPDGSPMFEPIEHAIAGRTEILGEPVVTGDILPGILDYYTYRGTLHSMPSVATTTVLFSNRDQLTRAGVTTAPDTWTGVEQVCEQVRALPDGPEHGITWSNHGMIIYQALAAQGGKITDADNGRDGRARTVDLASKEMLAWVQWWKQLHRDGHYVYPGGIPDWQTTFQAFADGDVALRLSSTNDVNYMAAAARAGGFELQVSRFPDNPNAPYEGNCLAGTSLWLTADLDEPTRDGALAFLQFLHNPVNAADQHRRNSFMPLTHASLALLEEEGWFDEHPYHRVGTDQLLELPTSGVAETQRAEGGRPVSHGALVGDFAGIQDVVTRAIQDVLVHDADPQERLVAATAEAQVLLDAYEADRTDGGISRPESVRVEFFTDTEAYSGADLENVVHLQHD